VTEERLSSQNRTESQPAGQPGPNTRAPRFRPAWFAGIDVATLNQVQSEWSFYDSLGTLVAALCCLSGISAAIAVGYVVNRPAIDFWWFGAVWICVVLCCERVILQMPNARSGLSAFSFLWRATLSILLAGLITEPVVMVFHQREIEAQLNHNTRTAIEKEFHAIDADFKPRFQDAHAELRHTRGRKADLEAKVAEDRKREIVAEENGLAGAAIAAQGEAKLHERRLSGAIERNDRRQPELHEKLSNLADAKGTKKAEAKREIEEGNGFEARVAALADVQAKWPSTDYAIWGLRLLFLILDLTPLAASIVYRQRPGAQPYEERRLAAWEWDALTAQRVREAVRVEKRRLTEEARGDMEVNQAQIAADVERRIFEATGERPPADVASSLVPNADLADIFDSGETSPQEDAKDEVPDVLRNGALASLALLGASTLIALLSIAVASASVSGTWFLVAALALSSGLCAYTRGYREAPGWAMPPILITFTVDLVSPALVLMINLK
jgi:hypothetical protein